MKLTEAQKMWIRAELLTFSADQMQAVRTGTDFNPDKEAKRRVDWIEEVVLSGLPVDSKRFQGA